MLDQLDDSTVHTKARLEPGKLFLIDFDQQRIIPDDELKESLAAQRPYEAWMADGPLRLADWVAEAAEAGAVPDPPPARATLNSTLSMHGFTKESVEVLLGAMVAGKEGLGSMGVDTPLAVLSSQPKPVSHYFKQLFAQVWAHSPVEPEPSRVRP